MFNDVSLYMLISNGSPFASLIKMYAHALFMFTMNLFSTGDKWKIRRKLLTPTFHFKILHDFVHVFNDQTRILLEKLNQHADGKPYNIFNDITLCALDIICGMGNMFFKSRIVRNHVLRVSDHLDVYT